MFGVSSLPLPRGVGESLYIAPIALRELICRQGKLGLLFFSGGSTVFQKRVGPIFLEGTRFWRSRLARKKPLSDEKIRQRLFGKWTKRFFFVYKGLFPLVFGQEFLYLKCSLAATACGYDGLAVAGVSHVAGSKYTGYVGGG